MVLNQPACNIMVQIRLRSRADEPRQKQRKLQNIQHAEKLLQEIEAAEELVNRTLLDQRAVLTTMNGMAEDFGTLASITEGEAGETTRFLLHRTMELLDATIRVNEQVRKISDGLVRSAEEARKWLVDGLKS